jgi:hypothetical protein
MTISQAILGDIDTLAALNKRLIWMKNTQTL